jgi:hypothetical protein
VGLLMPSRRPPAPPGPLLRGPVERGVEAWVVPGLAAHHVETFLPPWRRPSKRQAAGGNFSKIVKSVTAYSQRATL